MSIELLVLAGSPSLGAQDDRRQRMQHAVETMPGFLSANWHESPTAVAAVVATRPTGGTLVGVKRERGATRLTVATTARGLEMAGSTDMTGSEAAHVSVLLADSGAIAVTTDGAAFFPCFVATPLGGLFASTHLASLVSMGLSPEPDLQGLVEYLAMHHPLGTQTLLRDAAMLPPGGRLDWSPDSPPMRSATPAFAPTSDRIDDREVIEQFGELWPEVIADSLSGEGRTVIGLSGGLDSRAIAEAASSLGQYPLTYTYGLPPAWEPVTARRVAGRLGLPHASIPVAPDTMLANGPAILDRLDGAHSPSEMYELWFEDRLHGIADTVVNGLNGGTLWGDDKAIGLSSPDAVLARQRFRYLPEVTRASTFLVGDLGEAAPTMLHDGLAASISEWDFAERSDMVIFWRMNNRQARWGNMLTNALRRSGIRPEAPFLDSRFLALASRLSPAQRTNGRLYLEVHRRLFPISAQIPRSDDGNAPRALSHVYWSANSPYIRQLGLLSARHPVSGARRALRQATYEVTALGRRRLKMAGPADRYDSRRSVFPADVWLRRQPAYAARLADLLRMGEHPLFSTPSIESALASLTSGRVPALTLGRVAAAQFWTSDYERRAKAARVAALRPTATGQLT